MTREELIELYLSLDDSPRTTSIIEHISDMNDVSDPVYEIIKFKEYILEILRTQELHSL